MPQSGLFDVTYDQRSTKKFHVSGNVCRHFFIIIFLSFWPGCDRYVENDDEYRNRTITNVMENVADILQFRLAVSAIGNEYLCRKQDSSIPPITQLKDKSSLPAVKVSIDWVTGGIQSVCL